MPTTSEPRWLDPQEQRTWRAFMAASRLLLDTVDRQLQRESGMPHTYYEILVRLSEAPQRTLRMNELADASLSSRSRLSHAVSRLEELGWVRRENCPSDKRGLLAVLTAAGFAALDTAARGHVEAVRSCLFDPLTGPQAAALQQISETLLAHVEQVRATGSGEPTD